MKFSQVADRVAHYPKIVSVQNSYNLLCRTFDAGIAECCHHEGISLLAYSPLAMGILSGKYFAADGGPVDARLNVFKGMYSEGESRYNLSNNIIKAAALEYLAIAKKIWSSSCISCYCLCFETPSCCKRNIWSHQIMAAP